MINHKFELEKAVQGINYIIHKLKSNHIDKLDALKLIFLADRYHLRKYGRLITNDEYWAMTYGPVASSVKDIVGFDDYLSKFEKKYTTKYLKKYSKHQVSSIADVDFDVFSETDIEALDMAIEQKLKHSDLVEFTHLFTEWKRHELTISNQHKRVQMDLLDCFTNVDDNIEYCKVPQDELQLNKEHYIDLLEFDKAW